MTTQMTAAMTGMTTATLETMDDTALRTWLVAHVATTTTARAVTIKTLRGADVATLMGEFAEWRTDYADALAKYEQAVTFRPSYAPPGPTRTEMTAAGMVHDIERDMAYIARLINR